MRRLLAGAVLLVLIVGVGAPAPAAPGVTADAETPALYDDAAGGDADADDPAIWVHPRRAAGSLVIGTAKNGGLRVYDLLGRERQSIAAGPGGRFNNVDVVTGFRLGRQRVDLAVVTDRGRDRLRFYRIDPDAASPLVDVTAADVPLLFSADETEVAAQATGYGLAGYRAGDTTYAVVSRRHTTRLGQFALVARDGTVSYRRTDQLDLPRTFAVPGGTWTPCGEPGEDPQVEGMVVDAEVGALYAGQEDVGLWRIGVRAGRFTAERRIVERVAEYGVPATWDAATEDCTPGADPGLGGRIRADVEGATIYDTGYGGGYLLVSGQGDSRFFAYDRRTNAPRGTFNVGAGPRVDGAEHSDGAAAVSVPLPGYPRGLLVVHDGENTPDGGRVSTNFKYVDWRRLPLR